MYEPRPSRYAFRQFIVLTRTDGRESRAKIVNISDRGFGLELTDQFAAGDHVVLKSETGAVPAQIRWSIGNQAGGYFLPPKD